MEQQLEPSIDGTSPQQAPAAPAAATDTAPVFIVGASRSGTTLLSACLSNSAELWIGQETHYFDDLRPRLSGRELSALSDDDRARCEQYFMAFVHGVYGTPIARTWTEEDDRPDARVRRADLRALAGTLGPGADAYFEAFCRLQSMAHDKPRWGEKTPRHVFRIPELLERYPDAKIICMVRDPRAVTSSYRRFSKRAHRDTKRDDPKYQAWAEQDRKRISRSYHPLVSSLLWKASVGAATQAVARFGDERVRIVRYEDLATEPEQTLRSLSSWLSITFDRQMITNVPRMNSSYNAMEVDGGVTTDSIARWRDELAGTEIALIQHACRGPMRALGFEVDDVGGSRLLIVAAWLKLPFEAIPILWANRARITGSVGYIARRLRLALGAD